MNNREESWLYLLKFSRSRLAWAVLMISLSVSYILWQFSVLLVQDKTHARFETQSKQLKTAIEERLLNYEQVLAGSAGLFAVADLVGRVDWRTYVNKLNIERYYPGIQGLGYTERVSSTEVSEHVRRIRSQGLPEYLVSPMGERSEYHPVVFLEPLTQRNRRAFGYDAFGDPSHRAAMERSRDIGQVSMTGKVVLVQETLDEEQAGFVMYYPVYSHAATLESVVERRSALSGFVFSAFRMNNLMDGIVGLIAPFLDVKIYDSDVPVEEALMYASNLGSLDNDFTFDMSQTIEHGGKTWLLMSHTTPAFDYLNADPRPLIVLVSAVTVSFLLFFITLILIRARLIAQANAGKYRAITEGTSNMTVVLDEVGEVSYVSPSCEAVLGYGLMDLRRLNLSSLIHTDDQPLIKRYFERISHVGGNSVCPIHARVKNRKGEWVRVDGSLINMQDVPGVNGTVVNVSDVTELVDIKHDLDVARRFDPLTGLSNRESLKLTLKQVVDECKRQEETAALLFVDIDGFRHVNDSLGHDTGDALLKTFAQWLGQLTRSDDFISRLGGDKFAIIMRQQTSVEAIDNSVSKLLEGVSRKVRLGEHDVCVSASAGIALIPADSDDVASLMKFADLAMYRAKQQGRNARQFFSNGFNICATRKLLMQSELCFAIDNHQFILHYQPILALPERQVVAVDALLRWRHPDRGLIMPDQFMQIAEETGLVYRLGEWALRAACLQSAALKGAGFDRCAVSISVSPLQMIAADFVAKFEQVINETGVTPSALVLGVSSRILMHDLELVEQTFKKLIRLGVSITLNDLGTGNYSLSAVASLPIKFVKLDQQYLAGLAVDHRNAEKAEAIINLAHAHGLKVLSDGIDMRSQLEFLLGSGCDYAQGRLFSEPLDEEQLPGYLLNMARIPNDRFV